jgi:predicted GTPase
MISVRILIQGSEGSGKSLLAEAILHLLQRECINVHIVGDASEVDRMKRCKIKGTSAVKILSESEGRVYITVENWNTGNF